MQKEIRASLKGDAKKEDNKIILTSGLKSQGEVTIEQKLDFEESSWKCNFTVNISEPEGISDIDGQGGDGIRMKLCSESGQELFAATLDTYKNLENQSGNEVVLYFEGTKVAQAACRERFNDGKDKEIEVIYDNELETVVVKVNDLAVVAYAFNDIAFYELVKEPVFLCFSSFTGAAGGKHEVSNISIDF
jgi:hypothetical protein